MNGDVCGKFHIVRSLFPDKLIDGKYYLKEGYADFFTNLKYDTDLDKINAGCLFLFKHLFGNSYLFKEYTKNIKVVEYIMIWLSYMLNLKSHDGINTLNDFYKTYIEGNTDYTKPIIGVEAYKNYKDIIDKNNYLLSMDMSIISKFYDSFMLLCDMSTEIYANVLNCKDYLGKAQEFVKKYDYLNEKYFDFNEKHNITKGSSYNQILSTLSNDYNNLKNICKSRQSINYPSLPTYSQRSVIRSILIPFIFVVTAICLRIAYKVNNKEFKKYIHH
ncbi:hypothetical protein YYC_05822 [Plasmodium yoelii 17X]|uniref:Uncharacterized protein n=1 Tax=Plasmodium yoelii 17X TaxID=1323249 RepID=V7PDG5_PLAYE|nr:hypothetical protein YYC_05822 [Plasmodium yoelii 17X]